MKSRARPLSIAAIVGFAAPLAFAAPGGTVPRSSVSHYPARAQGKTVDIGAELLTSEQVHHVFASDLKRCCLVVEVAVYPQAGQTLDLQRDSFSLRVAGTKTAVKANSPKLIAAVLQKDANAERDVTVSPQGAIGYTVGRGTDPMTGREVTQRGTVTDLGVGVGIGGPGSAPGASAADASVMELELTEKGLPEGSTAAPVSGYLYFPLSSRKKKDAYQIEYVLNGETIVLPLSQ